MNNSFSETLETKLAMEAMGISEMAKTEDGREGIETFIQKCRPKIKGSYKQYEKCSP